MFFVDEPYISDFVKKTVKELQVPVVDTAAAGKMGLLPGTNLISEEQAIAEAKSSKNLVLYTTSENAIGWIAANLAFTEYPGKIDLFKNKAKFRRLIKPIYKDFFFKEILLADLKSIVYSELPNSFIIKPTVGFFSMGVRRVTSEEEWRKAIVSINAEMEQIRGLYPNEVLDVQSFIIEQVIEGDEFAIDAYFDGQGQPVILDILHHPFSSQMDVSDRVYTTSKEIIEANIDEFGQFLGRIGDLAGIRNFPVHVELRRDSSARLLPIEVNPMRFGGWCSTPDLAFSAYGVNPYKYYIRQERPDWSEILKEKQGKLYSVIILDNSTGKKAQEIAAFDYDRLWKKFERPLELRKIDYRKYPLFGFLFTETSEANRSELEEILKSDLKEFVL